MPASLGDPLRVEQAARLFAAGATTLQGLGTGLREDAAAVRWTGPAAERAIEHIDALARTGDGIAGRLTAASAALAGYAAVLRTQQTVVDRARADRFDAFRTLLTGLDPRACRDLAAAETDLYGAAAAVAAAAEETRARLLTLSASDEEPPGLPLGGDLVDGASWHPRDVRQGQIRDCYVLSTVMGYLRTDAGDTLLDEGVRWDTEAQGYRVRLYVDGEPVWYLVTERYEVGVTAGAPPEDGAEAPWNVAALYEAAIGQHLGFSDLDDGGMPEDVMELITGTKGTEYSTHHTWIPWDREYSGDRVLDALRAGSSVTAETIEPPGDDLYHPATAETYQDGALTQTSIGIVGGHSYAVIGVADDGSVILRNPWGAQLQVDDTGLPTDQGAVFRISAEDFRRVFPRVTVSEPAGDR